MKIFRAYDIRGVYPEDINSEVMEKIGKAFASYIKSSMVVVGKDVRTSSPELEGAFIRGLLESGKNVIEIGTVPLGVAMFHGWREGLPCAYITASHLPKEWNGVKFFHETGIGFMEDELQKIRDIYLGGTFLEGSGKLRMVNTQSVIDDYVDYLASKISLDRKLRIVLDCGNGAASLVAGKLFQKIGFDVEMVFSEPDGNFPNRSPDNTDDPLEKARELSR
ncbi:MAG TPA: phosphomannomutase, partial [Candidatus Aenigmarchaeota archaeon]|nr:phosphomannomutase [Candidatus Aenigmarchaeota archaeon]